MKKSALLSIHPHYAEAILEGDKRFEFRRKEFRRPSVDRVFLYATCPVKMVVGYFDIENIHIDRPETIWKKTREWSGVVKEQFDTYFHAREKAVAIEVKRAVRYRRPQPLSKYVTSNVPPQSFCYV
jgi:predicted transcriptional regulator